MYGGRMLDALSCPVIMLNRFLHTFSCKNSAKMFSLKYSHLHQFLANLIETLHFYYYCCVKFDDEFHILKKEYLSMSQWREKFLLI